MRNLNELDKYREKDPTWWPQTDKSGVFKVFVKDRSFMVIASVDEVGKGGVMEHISIRPKNQKRCPTWDEMVAIKDMFFHPEEACVQFHPRKSEYVNVHEYVLHIWRPVDGYLCVEPGLCEKTDKLMKRRHLCFDCDAEHCAFNPEGVCMYPMVYGKEPGQDFNGCKGFCYKEVL